MCSLHAVHPCAAPLRGGLQPYKSAILPLCQVGATEPKNRTLKRVIAMDGVYAAFTWSKKLPNCGF